MQIVPAAAWGRRTWVTAVPTVPPGDRTHFVVHHDGEHQVLREGASIPRAIDAAHRAQGWSGIGYNFVVSQDGQIWEGRGWGLVGAHCPGRNRDGIGVQIAVGGGQVPTAAALHAVRELYDEACRRAGRALVQTWHGAHYATDCPGLALIAWVRQGMPDPTPAAPAADLEDAMPTAREVADAILAAPVPTGEKGSDGQPLTYGWMFVRIYQGLAKVQARLDAGAPPAKP